MQSGHSRRHHLIAAWVVLAGLIISGIILKSLWTLDGNGLSALNRKLPIWDFSNLWAAGVLVLQGKTATLFDVDAYRAALRTLFTPLLTDQEWSYPPSMLLLAVPLALLPSWPAYAVWTLGTITLLYLAIRPMRLPLAANLAILVSPGVVMSTVVGQNGALTASLLLGGLLLAPRKPILAGILFGLLTVKPHLGLLVPFCLLASRNWRAISSAAVTTGVLVAATALLFGPSVWISFRSVTAPMMTAIMEAPWPQSYHALALTVFSAARSVGASLPVSYGVQGAISLSALAAAIWLWSPCQTNIRHETRVVLTGVLALIATPYGYVYDSVPLSVAAAWLFLHNRRVPLALHAAAWLLPLFVPALSLSGFGASIIVVIAYATANIVSLVRVHHGSSGAT